MAAVGSMAAAFHHPTVGNLELDLVFELNLVLMGQFDGFNIEGPRRRLFDGNEIGPHGELFNSPTSQDIQDVQKRKPRTGATLVRGFPVFGGDEKIRTSDTLLGYAPLAGECLRPLGHVSNRAAMIPAEPF